MSISTTNKDDGKGSDELLPSYDENTNKLIDKQTSSALLWLLFYSLLMFTLPFGAFFGTQYLLHTYFDLSEFTVTALSVASAVITVYVIIILYVYKAYKEKEIIIPGERSTKKKD